jgi:hypothetical protein
MPIGSIPVQLSPVASAEQPAAAGVERNSTDAAARVFTQQLALAQRVPARTPQGGILVRPQRTPMSGTQAASAIKTAYTELTGRAPSQGTLAILTSQWSLETGQGERMYYNFAGLKGQGPEGYTAKLHTREGWGANEQQIQDGFRAYTNADSGAKDYVSLLIRKFGSALEAAEAEDPAGFAQKLKSAGYYTGNEQAYASAVTKLANKAMGLGFDAVGAAQDGMDLGNAEIEPYFELPSAPSAGLASLGPGLLPNAELMNAGSSTNGQRLPTTAAFSDEISRAALRIAAQYGA